MIVLVIDVDGIGSFRGPSKGQSPILVDPNSPPTLATYRVKIPTWNVHILRPRCVIENGELQPNLFNVVRIEAFPVSLPPESLKFLRFEAPDHRIRPHTMGTNVMFSLT